MGFLKRFDLADQETKVILVCVIGILLFVILIGPVYTYLSHPPSDWVDVIPPIRGGTPMNLTTSTFNVTGEKWYIGWWPAECSPLDKCTIKLCNASTDMKLQEFALSTQWPEVSAGTENIKTIGSFYLEIQVTCEVCQRSDEAWIIRVREYKPQLPFGLWISWIIVIGVGLTIVFVGYEIYKSMSS